MKRANAIRTTALAVAVALAASGCIVQVGGPDYTPPEPVLPPAVPASAGAIYQESLDVRLFEDLRAHRVGDILTVRLAETAPAGVDDLAVRDEQPALGLAQLARGTLRQAKADLAHPHRDAPAVERLVHLADAVERDLLLVVDDAAGAADLVAPHEHQT